MARSLTLFDKFRLYTKLRGIESAMKTKDSTKILLSVVSLLTLFAQTGFVQDAVKAFFTAHPGIALALGGLAYVLSLLHVPVTPADPGEKSSSTGVSTFGIGILLVLSVALASVPLHAQELPQMPLDGFVAAGTSASIGGTPAVAGTALYAAALPTGTNTCSVTVIDVLPNTLKPLTVTTNVGTGIGQKLLTIGKVDVWGLASVGVQTNGAGNVGWQYSGGIGAPIKVKTFASGSALYIMPNLRFLKGSVANGTGVQTLIPGVLVGFKRKAG